MSESEVMTILLLFHLGAAFKNLKAFYVLYIRNFRRQSPTTGLRNSSGGLACHIKREKQYKTFREASKMDNAPSDGSTDSSYT